MKFLFLCLLLHCTSTIFAQHPGTLDPTFGNKGTILSDSSLLEGENVKVAKDGRILIGTIGPYKGFAYTFRIDALLPNGSPDLSFGEEGSAHVLFPGMTQPQNTASLSSLAILTDGRILAGGTLSAANNKDHIAFARFLPNGTIDSLFGRNGTATASFGYYGEGAGSILLQPDGKILSSSCVVTDVDQNIYQVSTARFLPDGTKDLSFGKEGIVVSNTRGCANAIALQKNGKIIAAGYSGNIFSTTGLFHIERYNEDGTYDKSFNEDGIVDTKPGAGSCSINDVVILDDGKIVVTGTSNGPTNVRLTVARYNNDGTLDAGFGKEGVAVTMFSQYSGIGKKVFSGGERDNKIVVAGSNVSFSSGYGDFALVGYNADGSLDSSFGNAGIQITDFDDGDYATGADQQPDGKIIMIGYAQSFQTFEDRRALARYFGYPQKVSLLVRIKRWLHNHSVSWKGLPAEDKVAYYSVEQSNSGSIGFLPIAKVSGAANLKDYAVSNAHLLDGMNYYRIKAVSTDGTIRYSEVAGADNIANTASIYPNPVRGNIVVQGLKSNETANIAIKDAAGTVLSKGVSSGSAQYRSSVSNLKPGAYYLYLITKDKTEVLPFVKE